MVGCPTSVGFIEATWHVGFAILSLSARCVVGQGCLESGSIFCPTELGVLVFGLLFLKAGTSFRKVWV